MPGHVGYYCTVLLILASASPRRAELLRSAGFAFETFPVDVDETPRDGERPAAYVRRLAAEKSACAAAGRPGAVILAADTAVILGDEILGKPMDDRDAAAMLRKLSGRSHEVMTGVSLRRDGFEVGRVETTLVRFAPLTPDEIDWYVASREGRDKAGAYGIQGLASRFIPRIEGSYSNVVGLPVDCLQALLRELSATVGPG